VVAPSFLSIVVLAAESVLIAEPWMAGESSTDFTVAVPGTRTRTAGESPTDFTVAVAGPRTVVESPTEVVVPATIIGPTTVKELPMAGGAFSSSSTPSTPS